MCVFFSCVVFLQTSSLIFGSPQHATDWIMSASSAGVHKGTLCYNLDCVLRQTNVQMPKQCNNLSFFFTRMEEVKVQHSETYIRMKLSWNEKLTERNAGTCVWMKMSLAQGMWFDLRRRLGERFSSCGGYAFPSIDLFPPNILKPCFIIMGRSSEDERIEKKEEKSNWFEIIGNRNPIHSV